MSSFVLFKSVTRRGGGGGGIQSVTRRGGGGLGELQQREHHGGQKSSDILAKKIWRSIHDSQSWKLWAWSRCCNNVTKKRSHTVELTQRCDWWREGQKCQALWEWMCTVAIMEYSYQREYPFRQTHIPQGWSPERPVEHWWSVHTTQHTVSHRFLRHPPAECWRRSECPSECRERTRWWSLQSGRFSQPQLSAENTHSHTPYWSSPTCGKRTQGDSMHGCIRCLIRIQSVWSDQVCDIRCDICWLHCAH